MWKDFFYYSKSERRAVCFLLVLILVLSVVVVYRTGNLPQGEELLSQDTSLTDSVRSASLQEQVVGKSVRPFPKALPRKHELFPFDPNKADSIELLDLGISRFAVSNILKYRRKGGRFTTPASFARIYGLSGEKFAELEPYLRIPAKVRIKDTVRNIRPVVPDSFLRVEKYPLGVTVNVGVADTAELKKIPGIGSGIAKNIVAYRERLGGFYDLSQLNEIKYMKPELMKWLVLGETEIRKMNINEAGLDRLRAHPYINFYQAKVIVEHRRKRGKIKSLSQLSLYEEFTEKDLERLSPYFSFD